MNKKWISTPVAGKQKPDKIAQERITYLYGLAKERFDTDPELSRTSIEHLRKLATKHNIRITDMKRTFCLECNSLLVPGKTCMVRVHNDRRVITCGNCGAVKRLGLT